jgi:hypothetical protein
MVSLIAIIDGWRFLVAVKNYNKFVQIVISDCSGGYHHILKFEVKNSPCGGYKKLSGDFNIMKACFNYEIVKCLNCKEL